VLECCLNVMFISCLSYQLLVQLSKRGFRKSCMSVITEPVDRELDGLLSLVAGGDRKAFGRVYDLTSPKLFAVVRSVVKRPELAEEALQEAFVKVWERASTYEKGSTRPFAWLAAIARNQAIDLKRRFAERMSDASVDIEEAYGIGIPAEAEQTLELKLLQKCLGQLPGERQNMVLLAYYQGWSRDELAARYKRPATTIKTLLRRSLASLKECLDGAA
jgi:RNA polymerase sigma-70 factor, ECF subfamily